MKMGQLGKRTNGKRAKQQRIRARKGRHLALESLEQRHLLSAVPLEIGGFVWDDLNGNGIRDANEPVIPGAVVNLLNADKNPILDETNNPVTTTTDANGFYRFTDLVISQPYRVGFELPGGTEGFNAFSPQQDASGNPTQSAGPVSDIITLPAVGLNIDTFDVGAQLLEIRGSSITSDSPVTESSVETNLPPEEVIGGKRELVLTVEQSLRGRPALVEVRPTGDGFLIWDNAAGVTSSTQVRWDGAGLDGDSVGLNADLTRGGRDNLFFLGIPFADLAASITLTVGDHQETFQR